MRDLCRLDNPADRLISVGSTNASTTDANGFYQHSLGADTSPSCNLIPLYPALVCDSYVTVARDCVDGTDGSTLDPDFDITAFNTSGSVAGGWFNSNPSNGQGAPDANGNVLIAQFSVKQNKDVTGTLTVYARLAGSDDITEYSLQAFDCFGGESGGGGGGEGSSGGSAPIPSGPESQGAGGCPTGTIWYVDDTAPGSDTGLNWTDAFVFLQRALKNPELSPGDQIWVAQGTYLPSDCVTYPPCMPGDHSDSFQLVDCVSIYGGFPDGGGARDPKTFISVLSGDIDQNDTPLNPPLPGCDYEGSVSICTNLNGLNSYHVVDGSGTEETALLDGFYITAGRADGIGPPDNRGAGIYVLDGSPRIHNCTVAVNLAESKGGGIYLENSNAVIGQDCCIAHNIADGGGGGGIAIWEGGAPTIQDSTILRNGAFAGGGITSWLASPTIRSNLIRLNRVQGNISLMVRGAGIAVQDEGLGTTLVEGNIIEENTGTSGTCPSYCHVLCTSSGAMDGVGLYVKDTTDDKTEIRDNIIRSNSSDAGRGDGGGMYCEDASPRVEGNLFEDNAAGRGAGMFNDNSHPLVVDCEFRHNGFNHLNFPVTDHGGGMYNDLSNPGIYNSRFVDNVARGSGGGGIYNAQSAPVVVNSLFFDNEAPSKSNGGAILDAPGSSSTIHNCTFGGNSADGEGGALYSAGGSGNPMDLANNILWGNTATDGPEIFVAENSAVTVDFSDVQGGEEAVGGDGDPIWGDGNINVVPVFADAGNGNYHIKPTSPCIDAADNTAVPPGITTDLDGEDRFIDDPDAPPTGNPPGEEVLVDMGCYEFQLCPGASGSCPWDLNDDGTVGPFDLAFLLGSWGLNPGHPADFDCDGFVGPFDLAILLGNWGPCP